MAPYKAKTAIDPVTTPSQTRKLLNFKDFFLPKH